MMQSVITRMAENNRACKTWAVTLVAAILVVVARFGSSNNEAAFGPETTLIALVPTVLFWLLDSYYLALERSFRKNYDDFVQRLHQKILRHGEVFEISLKRSVKLEAVKCAFKFVTGGFYVILAAAIFAFWLIIC